MLSNNKWDKFYSAKFFNPQKPPFFGHSLFAIQKAKLLRVHMKMSAKQHQ